MALEDNGNSERLPPGRRPAPRHDRVDVRLLTPRQIGLLNALADEMRAVAPNDPDVLHPDGARVARMAEDILKRGE